MKNPINEDTISIQQGYHRVASTSLNMYTYIGEQMALMTQAERGELIYVLGISDADSAYVDAVRIFDGEHAVIPATSIHHCIDITDYNTYQKCIDARGNPARLPRQSLINELLELIERHARYREMGNEYAKNWTIRHTKHRKGDVPPLGIPGEYVSGANTDGNFDGPGLVQHVYYTHNGIQLPRTAAQQFELCHQIQREDLKPGDLIFFQKKQDNDGGEGEIVHVGIALDTKGHYCHASDSYGGVGVHSLESITADTTRTIPTWLEGKQQTIYIDAAMNEHYRNDFTILFGRVERQFIPDYSSIPEDNRPTPRCGS